MRIELCSIASNCPVGWPMLRCGIFIALLVPFAGGLAPRTASASCGDWLAHSEQPVTHASYDAARQASPSPTTPPATPNRCTGPRCGRSPMSPIPAPTDPAVKRFHQESAFMFASSTEESCLNARFVVELDLVLPSGHPLSIYRPPKS